MRLTALVGLVLVLAGFCVAQDTNFSTGPQYLMNFGSPQFLQPISTPTLSLSLPPAGTPAVATEVTAETVPAPSGEKIQTDLPRIYWGDKNAASTAEGVSEIEVSSAQPSTLPGGFVNAGVVQMVNARDVQARGYGVSLGDVAAYWKARKLRAPRVYTNADVARLHGG